MAPALTSSRQWCSDELTKTGKVAVKPLSPQFTSSGLVVSQQIRSHVQMSITTIFIAAFLPVACIAVADALMRFFDVKEAGANRAQSDAEKLLIQVNREVTARHRVRAGAPSTATLSDFSHFSSLSATRIRFPSA